jgi:hypothetical protein
MIPGLINGLTTIQETTLISISPLVQSEAMSLSPILYGSQQVGFGKIVFTIIKIVVCVAVPILVAMIGIGVAVAAMTVAAVVAFITVDISRDGTTILTQVLKEPSSTPPQQMLPIVSQLP